MKYSNNRELSDKVEFLVKRGWVWSDGRKHGKLTLPGHSTICLIVSKSPSDYMAHSMFQRDVRRKLKEIGLPDPFASA